MVAIVSGNSVGLNLTSLGLLSGSNSLGQQGGNGVFGTAAQGSAQEQVYVNASTGGIVLQDQDAVLTGIDDSDIDSTRTYNTTSGSNWSMVPVKSIAVIRQGAAGAILSIQRTDVDGSVSTFTFNSTLNEYVQTGGQSSTFNTITVGANGYYTWTNGSTGATETYYINPTTLSGPIVGGPITTKPSGVSAGGASAATLGGGSTLIATGSQFTGNIVSATDQYGQTTSYAYTAGNLTSITTGDGESVNYTWTNGLLTATSVKLANGTTLNEVSYGYDSNTRLTSVTVNLDADGSVPTGAETASTYATTYTYDSASGNIASITQSDGTKLSFTYVKASGVYKLASYTDGNGATTTLTYATNSTTIKDAYGSPSVFNYDSSGRLLSVVKGTAATGSSTISYAYNTQGEVSKITDGAGRTVSMTYDTAGRLLTQTDALNDVLTLTYNASNQVATRTVSGTGVASDVDRYVYAAVLGTALRFSISPEGVVTEYRYNSQYQVTSTLVYDARYDLSALGATDVPTEAQMAAWAAAQDQTQVQREDFSYDLRGNLAATTTYGSVDASGNGVTATASTTQYVYDQRGMLLQTIAPDTATTSNWVYDQLGRQLVATTSGAGAPATSTLTQYDDAHGKTIVTQANGEVTTSTIDANGRVVSVTQLTTGGGTATTQYAYDADGNLLMTTDPTGEHTWMFYDGAGRMVGEVNSAGDLVQYTYDASNRVTLVQKFLGVVDVTKLVDANGKPTTATNGNPASGAVTLASIRPTSGGTDNSWTYYDKAGRVLYTVDGLGYVTQYDYDAASNVTDTIQYATAIATAALGNGQTATTPATLVVASAQDRRETTLYNRDGQVAATIDGDGYVTAYTYDGSGRVVQSTAYATALAGYPNAATLAAIATARTSDSLAGVLPAASAGDISTYSLYNDKGQLVGQVDGEGYLTETVYDADGRVAQTVRYANRAVQPVTTTSTLAAIRPASDPADRSVTTTYDDFGRVKTQTNYDGSVTTDTYDAVGNLVQSTVATGTADQRTVMAQYDLQGRLTASLSADGAALLTGNQTAAQVAAIWSQYGTTYTYDAAGRLLSQTAPDANRTVYYYDDAGRLRFTVDADGGVTENTYDALGDTASTIVYATAVTAAALAAMTGGLLSSSANASAVTALATASTANTTLNTNTQYGYDADQHLHSTALGGVRTDTYAYDAFGDRTSTTQTTTVGTAETTVFSSTFDRRGDAIGQAVAITTGTGSASSTSATYDAFGRVATQTDAMGNTTVNTYDKLGRVVAVTDPQGDVQAATYDAFGRVLTRTDALGHVTRYHYDDQAHSLVVTMPEGITYSTATNAEGQTTSVVDGDGNTTQYRYDADGNLLTTTDASGVVTNAYDAADLLVQTTDGNGTVTAYTYDPLGRVLTRTVDPTGLDLVTTYKYDAKGELVTTIDPRGVTTAMTYDRIGQLMTSAVDPSGLNLVTSYSYDQIGDVLTVTSPAGNVTQYVYDNLGRRTQTIVDPGTLKLTTTYTFDADNHVVATTDPDGNVTRYVYDADGRVTYTVDGAGDVTHTVYDAQGNVIETIGYANAIDLAQWDGVSVPNVVADPERDSDVHTFYDHDNRARYILTDTGANGGTTYDITELDYDGDGNVTQRIDYATPVVVYKLPHHLEHIAALTDGLRDYGKDRVTQNIYDAAGNLAWTADGMGDVVHFAYDADGRVIKETAYANQLEPGQDPKTVQPSGTGVDRTSYFAYDSAGRLVYSVDGTGAVTQNVVDADGNVVQTIAYAQTIFPTTSKLTAAQIAADVVTTDPQNRVTRSVYDNASRRVYSIDALGDVTLYNYDRSGRVTSTTAYADAIGAASLAILTPAATAANVSALLQTDPSDRNTTMAYDGAGRLVFVVNALGFVTQTGYDADGNVTLIIAYGNAVAAPVFNGTAATIAAALHPDPTLDRTQRFTYDAAGNQRSATDALGNKELYGYDALGNRTSVTKANGATCTYEYDAAGNQIFAIEPSSDPTQSSVTTQYVYDGLGNMITRYDAVGTSLEQKTNYAYDALSRLTSTSVAEHVYQLPPTDGYGGYGGYGDPYGGYGDPYGGDPYGGDGGGDDSNQPGTPYYHDASATDYMDAGPIADDPGRTEIIEDATTRNVYDAFGDLVATTDPAGNTEVRTYDHAGRVTFDIDAAGATTLYQRNAFGDAVSTTVYATNFDFGSGQPVPDTVAIYQDLSYYFSEPWLVQQRTTTSTYDALGQLTSVTQPAVWVDDGAGHSMLASPVTKYSYNSYGELIESSQLADASANTWANTIYIRDKVGQVTSEIDPMNFLTTRAYDAVGNVTKVVEYANPVTNPSTTSYTAPATSTLDRETDYTYDLDDNVTTQTQVGVTYSTASDGTSTTGNLTTSYTYDVLGNVSSVTDPLGRVTYSYYDANGLLAATAGPASTSVVDGQTTTFIPLTTYVRDVNGNVTQEIEHGAGAASATTAGFTVAANTSASESGVTTDDRITTTIYDLLGRVITVIDPDGQSHYTSYDIDGRVAKTWDYATEANGHQISDVTLDSYDELGRLVDEQTSGDAGTDLISHSTTYDGFGEVVDTYTSSSSNGLVSATEYEYDAAGRLWRTSSENVYTVYQNNLLGYRTAVITPTDSGTNGTDGADLGTVVNAQAADALTGNVARTDYQTDLLGRVLVQTLPSRVNGASTSSTPERPTIQQTWDRWGNLLTQTDVRNAAWVTSFAYNANDQVIQEIQPDATGALGASAIVTQTYYDAAGRQVAQRDVDGLTTQTWDAADNVVSTTRIDGKTLAYAYNIFGNLIETTDATGNITKYGYDQGGHQLFAARVDDDTVDAGSDLGVAAATIIERSSYDDAGNLIVDVDAEGDTTEYVYGNDNQAIETIKFQNKSDLSAIYGQGGDLPDGGDDTRTFVVRDALGRVIWSGGNDTGETHYLYTSTGQISQIIQGTYNLSPDAVGDGYDPANYYTQDSDTRVQSFLYDTAGRLVASVDGDNYMTRYTYDAAGRLIDSYQYAQPMTASVDQQLWYYDFQDYAISSDQLAELTPAASAADVQLHYFYDDAGNLVGQTDGDGYLTETTYDAHDQVTKQVLYATPVTAAITASTTLSQIRPAADAGDQTTTNVWDTRGRLTSTTDPLGTVTTYTYDINNDVVQETVSVPSTGTGTAYAAATMTTLSRYDSEGRLLQQLPPQGAALITSGMTSDQVEAIWNQYGTKYVYDAAGRLTATIAPDDDRTLFYYNDAGQIVYTIDATGGITEDDYDGTGQVSATTVYSTPIDAATLATMQGGLVTAVATAGDVGAISAAEESSDDAQTTNYYYDGAGRLTDVIDDVGDKYTQYNAFGEVDLTSNSTYEYYDHRGNVIEQIHADSGGGTIAFQSFDAFGRIATQTDAYGNRTTYSYDHDGQLITTTDPTGDSTHTVYDVRGRVLQTTDLLGNVTTYAYTDSPRTMSVTTPDGIVYKSTYDGFGRLISVTDINGATTTYSYDLAGDVLSVTGPDGTVTNTYDAADRLITTTDSSTGIETDHTYDAVGRVLTVTVDPHGLDQVTTYAYDTSGNAVTTTAPNGLVTQRTFDSEGDVLTSTVDPGGLSLTTTYTYDLENNVTSVTTPDGDVTNYYYAEGSNRLLTTQTTHVYEFETVETETDYSYDRDGRVSSVSSGDSTTYYTYDADGRVNFTVDGMGDVTQTVYDAAGDVLDTIQYATPIDVDAWDGASPPPVVSSPSDRHDYRLYDNLGRVTATVDSEGDVTSYTYDAESRVIATRAYATQLDHGNPAALAAAVAAARSTGSLSALLPATAALDQTTHVFYDALGRAVGQVDAAGMLTVTSYDTANRVTGTIAYATPVTTAITAATTLASITPAAQAADRRTTTTYDILGRVTSSTDWQGDVTTYGYDVAGNLVQTTVAQGTSDARTTMTRYDIAGRAIATLSADGAALLQPGMTPDQVDAIWAEYGTTYTYDGEGHVASMTDPDGVRTLYYYDDAGNLRYTVDGAGDVTENTYDRGDRLQTTVKYASAIDAATLAGMTGGTMVPPAAGMNAMGGVHVLTIIGGGGEGGWQLQQIFDDARDANLSENSVTQYQYDAAGRLSIVTDPDGNTTTYGYDAFGDVASTTKSNVGGHSTVSTESYDTRGLETGSVLDVSGADVTMSVVRDAFGRIVSEIDGDNKTSKTSYDVVGRIIGTLDPMDGTESFQYDVFGRVLSQMDARGDVTSYHYDDADRTVTMTTQEGISLSTTVNREGETVASVDGDGNITTYVYDADGNLKSTTSAAGTTSSVYDAADRLEFSTDLSGTTTHTTYDAAGRVFQRTVDPDGLALVTTTTYDAKSQLFETTDPAGIVTRTIYDLDGNVLTSTVDPDGLALTTTYSHDQDGNVLTVTSPAGEKIQYAYDGLDRRTQTIVDPDGLHLVTSYVYDGDNHVVASTDADLNTTRFSYDDDGRLSYSVDGAGDVSHVIYDAKGNIVESIAYANKIDPASWDGTGTPPVVADPTRDSDILTVYDGDDRAVYTLAHFGGAGQSYAITQTQYDGNGNVLSKVTFAKSLTTPNPPTTKGALDTLALQLTIPGQDQSVHNLYDAAGDLTWTVDALGHVQQFQYDASGHVTKQIAYANALAAGAAPQSVVASDDDRITTTTYDDAGRAVYTIDALGTVTHDVLDADGNVVETIAYATRQPAPTATSDVPTASELSQTLDDSDVDNRRTYAVFDAAGRQTWSIDAAGDVIHRAYDADGNVIGATQYGKPITSVFATPPSASQVEDALVAPQDQRTTIAAYDAAGRRVYTIDGGGYVTETGYDGVNNATSTTVYSQPVSGIAPGASLADIQGALAVAAGAGRTETTQYDADGRETASIDALGHAELQEYDGLGQRIALTDRDGATWHYGYDAAGKMTSEVAPSSDPSLASVTTLYNYDVFGNQSSKTEAAGTALARTTYYGYDAQGRLLSTQLAPVGVYVPGSDPINGAPEFIGPVEGDPGRHDVLETLVSSNVYDAFGDLVATTTYSTGPTDPAAAVTLHTYDKLGDLTYDVDALGHVTGYGHNVFGDVTSVTRYGVTIGVASFAAAALAGSVQLDGDQVTQLLDATPRPASTPVDRTTSMTVDALGRTTQVQQPSAWVYDGNGNSHWGAAITQTTYDGYGEVVQTSVLIDSVADTWARTTNYYDASGNQYATVDADGYATVRTFDALGSVVSQTEYAQQTDSSTLDSFTQTKVSALDRTIVNEYDAAERVVSSTQVGVEYSDTIDGSTVVGDLKTSYTYDAVGNQTSITDPLGQTTYSYYDGNGKLIAQVQPERTSVVDGQTYTYCPLTTFTRDALGRVVKQTVSGVGAVNPTVSGYSMATAAVVDGSGGPAPDRVTYMTYDSRDNVTSIVDPGNESHYFSYDAQGREAKSWAWAKEADGSWIDDYTETTYDAVGDVVAERTPASTEVLVDGVAQSISQDAAGSVIVTMKYDAFGEMVERDTAQGANTATTGDMSAPDAKLETFEYDAAGRLWRTNSNGGNVTITLYDQRGLATAQLTSDGLAGLHPQNLDLSTIDDAMDADGLGSDGIARTETQYDAMGRAVKITLPARQFGTSVVAPFIDQTFDRWGNVLSQSDARDKDWITVFTYDFNNDLTSESQPDDEGGQSDASPVTRFYYDALGRKVATRDADGNVNGQVWDSGNNLIEEHHADGGVVLHAYDIFNEQVRLTTAEGGVTRYTYDAIGDNTGIGHVGVDVYTTSDGLNVSLPTNTTVWTYSHYDALGHKIADIDGMGVMTNYVLDARGNVVETIQAVGTALQRTSESTFNAEDLEVGNVDALGSVATWKYDGFGRLQARTDIGGTNYSYQYDNAGRMVLQQSDHGEYISNTYDTAGQLIQVEDDGIHQTTGYSYNLIGEHTGESMLDTSGAQYYQLQELGYDKLGRLVLVNDLVNSTQVMTTYDAVGNKMHEEVTYIPHGQASTTVQELWFAYDNMNQQILADGAYDSNAKDLNNLTAQQGHILTYDKDGNRTSDTSYGTEVVQFLSVSVSGYDESGAEFSTTSSYVSQQGVNTHFYNYDKMDRLSGVSVAAWGDVVTGQTEEYVQINGDTSAWEWVPTFTVEALPTQDAVVVDTRKYDADGREVASGPANLPTDYIQALVGNNADLSGATSTVSTYDVLGEIQTQHVVNLANGSLDSDTTFEQYDKAGNLLTYKTTQGGTELDTTVTIEKLDGYKEKQTAASTWGSQGVSDTLVDTYDVDGNLVALHGNSSAEDRTFVNDVNGQVLVKTQDDSNVLKELIADGHVMGTYGYGMGTKPDGTSGYIAQADFDLAFTPVTNSYPNATTGQYPVQPGDSLESIALQAYGDSSLWYLIAEANDLSDDSDLRVGQVLNIPTKVNASHDNDSTYAPYDPTKIEGSSSPDLSLIHKKDKWGWLSDLIGIAVTYIASAIPVVGFWLGPLLGDVARQYSAAALNNRLDYGDMIRRGLGNGLLAGVNGFAGTQWVVDHRSDPPGFDKGSTFDWKATAVATVMGAIEGGGDDGVGESAATDGLTTEVVAENVAQGVAQGLAADAVNQGVRNAFGEEHGFDWREFGAAGVGGGVSAGISIGVQAYGPAAVSGDVNWSRVAGDAGAAVGSLATAALSGQKWNTLDALVGAVGAAAQADFAAPLQNSPQEQFQTLEHQAADNDEDTAAMNAADMNRMTAAAAQAAAPQYPSAGGAPGEIPPPVFGDQLPNLSSPQDLEWNQAVQLPSGSPGVVPTDSPVSGQALTATDVAGSGPVSGASSYGIEGNRYIYTYDDDPEILAGGPLGTTNADATQQGPGTGTPGQVPLQTDDADLGGAGVSVQSGYGLTWMTGASGDGAAATGAAASGLSATPPSQILVGPDDLKIDPSLVTDAINSLSPVMPVVADTVPSPLTPSQAEIDNSMTGDTNNKSVGDLWSGRPATPPSVSPNPGPGPSTPATGAMPGETTPVAPAPQPIPVPQPAPEPVPEPMPAPVPVPQPTPAPVPSPTPNPQPSSPAHAPWSGRLPIAPTPVATSHASAASPVPQPIRLPQPALRSAPLPGAAVGAPRNYSIAPAPHMVQAPATVAQSAPLARLRDVNGRALGKPELAFGFDNVDALLNWKNPSVNINPNKLTYGDQIRTQRERDHEPTDINSIRNVALGNMLVAMNGLVSPGDAPKVSQSQDPVGYERYMGAKMFVVNASKGHLPFVENGVTYNFLQRGKPNPADIGLEANRKYWDPNEDNSTIGDRLLAGAPTLILAGVGMRVSYTSFMRSELGVTIARPAAPRMPLGDHELAEADLSKPSGKVEYTPSPATPKSPIGNTAIDGVPAAGAAANGAEPTVTVFRVQGGTPPLASRQLITIDANGNPVIRRTTLNVSIGDPAHAEYFLSNRPGADITSFDIPQWMGDFIDEQAVPQAGYRTNPANQGGLAPKVVDPTTPGRSYELPDIWAKWLQEVAVPGSGKVTKGGTP